MGFFKTEQLPVIAPESEGSLSLFLLFRFDQDPAAFFHPGIQGSRIVESNLSLPGRHMSTFGRARALLFGCRYLPGPKGFCRPSRAVRQLNSIDGRPVRLPGGGSARYAAGKIRAWPLPPPCHAGERSTVSRCTIEGQLTGSTGPGRRRTKNCHRIEHRSRRCGSAPQGAPKAVP